MKDERFEGSSQQDSCLVFQLLEYCLLQLSCPCEGEGALLIWIVKALLELRLDLLFALSLSMVDRVIRLPHLVKFKQESRYFCMSKSGTSAQLIQFIEEYIFENSLKKELCQL